MKKNKIILFLTILVISFSALVVSADDVTRQMPDGAMGGRRMMNGEIPEGMENRVPPARKNMTQPMTEQTPQTEEEKTEQPESSQGNEQFQQRFPRGEFGAEGQIPPEFEGGFQGRPWGNMEQQPQKEEEQKPFLVKYFDLILSSLVLVFGFLFVVFFRKKYI